MNQQKYTGMSCQEPEKAVFQEAARLLLAVVGFMCEGASRRAVGWWKGGRDALSSVAAWKTWHVFAVFFDIF